MVLKVTPYSVRNDTIWCHLSTPYGVVPNGIPHGVKFDTMEFREYTLTDVVGPYQKIQT